MFGHQVCLVNLQDLMKSLVPWTNERWVSRKMGRRSAGGDGKWGERVALSGKTALVQLGLAAPRNQAAQGLGGRTHSRLDVCRDGHAFAGAESRMGQQIWAICLDLPTV